jgi:hypothetical protein
MAQADSADTTTLPALSRPGNSAAHRLFHMPAGLSTERPPFDLPPVDRSALMRRAHEIARKFRPTWLHIGCGTDGRALGAWSRPPASSPCSVPRSRTAPLRPNRSPPAARRPTVAGSLPRWREVHHSAQGHGGAQCAS